MTAFLLVSSLLAFALLAYAAHRENFGAEWHAHQSDYKQRLLARATTERERSAAERFEVRQTQLYLPDLGRVDRCTTCHVAIDDPAMKDAPQPLAAHPGTILTDHPKERFGCTICHHGQGRGTTTADAHGHVAHWLEPMLSHDELDQSCPLCHSQESLPGAGRYNAAMGLFFDNACLSCHQLRGQGGDAGPDISDAGKIHDAEWHFKHFKDPQSVVETSEMPNFTLSDEEAKSLTFLMMSLTGEPIPTDLLSNPKLKAVDTRPAKVVDPEALKGYIGSQVCLGCHEGLHADAVDGWRASKMSSTYERIKDEPVKDNCLPCHTTGFNPRTGHYAEAGVGCEGCHGPGAEAVKLVVGGKLDEHKKAIRLDRESTLVCVGCHNPHVPRGTHAEYYRKQPLRLPESRSGDGRRAENPKL